MRRCGGAFSSHSSETLSLVLVYICPHRKCPYPSPSLSKERPVQGTRRIPVTVSLTATSPSLQRKVTVGSNTSPVRHLLLIPLTELARMGGEGASLPKSL